MNLRFVRILKLNILHDNSRPIIQEKWLSPTERASVTVSAISLRHIIWLYIPHESHAGLSLPSADWRVQAFGYVKRVKGTFWPPLHGYAHGTIAVTVTWMERGFNACQTHRSMYPYIFNRLRAIARYSSEIALFLPLNCIWRCSHWNSGKSLVLRKLES